MAEPKGDRPLVDRSAGRVLPALLEGTTGTVSGEFFQGVVGSLASCLEVQTAFVSELVAPDRVRLLSLWHAGALRDGLEYTLPETNGEPTDGG